MASPLAGLSDIYFANAGSIPDEIMNLTWISWISQGPQNNKMQVKGIRLHIYSRVQYLNLIDLP